ncbi:MAG: JAB domain-containing protein [Halieaceae bacterium]
MKNDLLCILLIAELLNISLSTAETLVRSCPSSASMRGFFRRLSEGELDHPALTKTGRLRIKALLHLQTLMAEQRLEVSQEGINWGELQRYVVDALDGRVRETFIAVFLGPQRKFIASEILFVGSADRAWVDHRVVLTRALSHQALSIVVAHNHPSGSLIPSASDIETTRKLARCLKLVDIALADHLIVASGRCESLRNLGFV